MRRCLIFIILQPHTITEKTGTGMKIFYLGLFLWGAASPLQAYDFVCDSIYYNITSSYNLTVEVTRGDVKYAGNISVPSVVEYRIGHIVLQQ